jgi:SAM-dependent methyltransferase
MDESEFDRFAEEYSALHAANIRASGESPEFFSEYKVRDLAALVAEGRMRPPVEILDFGAGIGGSVPYFKSYFPKSALTCLDVSRRSLDIGRSRFGSEAAFEHFHGNRAPFADRSFDLIFAACVFHHISEVRHVELFAELRRLLRSGGSFVVYEHNPYNPLTRRAVDTCAFDENAVLIRPAAMRERIRSAGFAQCAIDFRIFFPGALRRMRALEPWLTWLPLGAQYRAHARVD